MKRKMLSTQTVIDLEEAIEEVQRLLGYARDELRAAPSSEEQRSFMESLSMVTAILDDLLEDR